MCAIHEWQLSSKWRNFDSRPQGAASHIKQQRSLWSVKTSILVSSCKESHLAMRQKPLSLRLYLLRPNNSGELCKGAVCRFGRCRHVPLWRLTLFCHSCRHFQDLVRPGHWPKQYDVKQMLWVSRLLMHQMMLRRYVRMACCHTLCPAAARRFGRRLHRLHGHPANRV